MHLVEPSETVGDAPDAPAPTPAPAAVAAVPRILLTVEEAGAALSLSRAEMFRFLADYRADPVGGIPYIKLGRRTLIHVDELRAWADQEVRRQRVAGQAARPARSRVGARRARHG